ncbi:MAG: hypothetical protein LBQ83_02320 [Candidatus Margulisbacteria bacterium]|nr:hypothetical protein [Candidatus Margulisiibacteriota bacterium]
MRLNITLVVIKSNAPVNNNLYSAAVKTMFEIRHPDSVETYELSAGT